MIIKSNIKVKSIFILVFIGIAFSLFLMSILDGGKLDRSIFKSKEVTIRGIYIDDIPIWVEVANTIEKRRVGLSGRKKLSEDRGMLFVFDRLDRHGIWMKDMNFPIDILWIDENHEIIDIKKDAQIESFPEVFRPSDYSKYVVEVNSGFIEMNDINIGDEVILQIL
ncbi:MAG: DUF192 domain-containing protein [Parcubacteria group bacterium]|nr:DUF192 domain-containing protein [Parcubacteria group bacterium]